MERKIDYFDLKQIADSGQCFRMNRLEDNSYGVISCGRYLKISQSGNDGNEFTFSCPKEDEPFWIHYFDLDRDYGAINGAVWEKDEYLKKSAEAGKGIRILNQEPWEMIITFIISQQKTIPKIKEGVEALSLRYGTRIPVPDGAELYSFPSPKQLSNASLEDLQSLKFGYRAKYIRQVCLDACNGKLDLQKLQTMDYQQAMTYLKGFYGIGEKVANCICLFGLHHIDAFPVDTWIQKILMNEYYNESYAALPKARQIPAMIEDGFGRYRGFAGVMQQYIFYYERLRNGK